MEFFELDLSGLDKNGRDRLYLYAIWLCGVSQDDLREGRAERKFMVVPDVPVRVPGQPGVVLLSELVGFAQEALSPPHGWSGVRAEELCGRMVGRRVWWCAEGSGGGRRSVVCGEVGEVRFREGNQPRVSLRFPDGSADIFNLTDDLQVWVEPPTEEGS